MQRRSDNITTAEPDCKVEVMIEEKQGKGERGERSGRIKQTDKS